MSLIKVKVIRKDMRTLEIGSWSIPLRYSDKQDMLFYIVEELKDPSTEKIELLKIE